MVACFVMPGALPFPERVKYSMLVPRFYSSCGKGSRTGPPNPSEWGAVSRDRAAKGCSDSIAVITIGVVTCRSTTRRGT
jgi:hypothetical protein